MTTDENVHQFAPRPKPRPFFNPHSKEHAVAYCEHIGADPFEEVSCFFRDPAREVELGHARVERWQLYIGAPLK